MPADNGRARLVSVARAAQRTTFLVGRFGDSRHEPITPTRNRGNQGLVARRHTKQLPQEEDVLADCCLFNDAVWPDLPEQILPASDVAAAANERDQNIEGFRRGREGLASSSEDPAGGIERKRPEAVDDAGTHRES